MGPIIAVRGGGVNLTRHFGRFLVQSGAVTRATWPMGTLLPLACLGLCGCVERYIQVRSDPPDATVTLDDKVVGKTPLDIPYVWYGKRLLAVELKGYQQVRETIALNPPWWQYFPLDFIT